MSIGIEPYWRDEKMSEMVTLRHYDCEVDAVWTIDQEADDSLQIVYERDGLPNGEKENFYLYLCPHSAEIIGEIIRAWGAARARRSQSPHPLTTSRVDVKK